MLLSLIKWITAGCLLLPARSFAQADLHLSQFYETSILRNPALTGVSEGNYKVAAYYRNQWSSIANPYETALLDLEYRVSLGRGSDFVSFGVLGYGDRAGDLNQTITAAYPAVNFNKCLDKYNNAYLSLGFVGGFLQYSFDKSKATFDNQFVGGSYNASNPTFEHIPNTTMSVFDLGAGLNFNMSPGDNAKSTYLVGVSAYHITKPTFSYYQAVGVNQNMRWNVNAGVARDIGSTTMFQAHFNYAEQGAYREFLVGGLLGWKQFKPYSETPVFEIFAGAMYRYGDAIIPVLKLKYKDFGIGLSYDINTSDLRVGTKQQGGPEITLNFTGNLPRNKAYPNTVCPRFN